jgi:Flp pilus assembly pilin Flp
MFDRIQVILGRAFSLEAKELKRDDGQTVTEYAVVLGVLIVGVAGIVFVLQDAVNGILIRAANKIAALLP